MAEGTADEPIVFTSQAADGREARGRLGRHRHPRQGARQLPAAAQGNIEGILTTARRHAVRRQRSATTTAASLQYVRIEYAGVVLAPTTRSTASRSAASAGHQGRPHPGPQGARRLLRVLRRHRRREAPRLPHNQDDGFDSDNGFSGRLQFLVAPAGSGPRGRRQRLRERQRRRGLGQHPVHEPHGLQRDALRQEQGRERPAVRPPPPQEHARHVPEPRRRRLSGGPRHPRRHRRGRRAVNRELARLEQRRRRRGILRHRPDRLQRGQDHHSAGRGRDQVQSASRIYSDDTTDEIGWYKDGVGNKFDLDPGIAGCFNSAARSSAPRRRSRTAPTRLPRTASSTRPPTTRARSRTRTTSGRRRASGPSGPRTETSLDPFFDRFLQRQGASPLGRAPFRFVKTREPASGSELRGSSRGGAPRNLKTREPASGSEFRGSSRGGAPRNFEGGVSGPFGVMHPCWSCAGVAENPRDFRGEAGDVRERTEARDDDHLGGRP